jgi:hypothetical protein
MVHSYDMRNKSDLFILRHNTKLFEESVGHNGVVIYNKLSREIKSVTCIMKLKNMIINFSLEKRVYSVEEFMTIDP